MVWPRPGYHRTVPFMYYVFAFIECYFSLARANFADIAAPHDGAGVLFPSICLV